MWILLLPVAALLMAMASSRAAEDVILATFDTEADLKKVETEQSVELELEAIPGAKSMALKAVLPPGPWPGVHIHRLPVTNWKGKQVLKFEVHSTWEGGFGIRIDSTESRDYSTRYNGTSAIQKGWNRYQVDLKKVAGSPRLSI